MNRNMRVRVGLRQQARRRVRVATRWTALASGGLAAAFTMVLTHYGAPATAQSSQPSTTPAATSRPLQPPAQAPTVEFGGGYLNYGSSGGS